MLVDRSSVYDLTSRSVRVHGAASRWVTRLMCGVACAAWLGPATPTHASDGSLSSSQNIANTRTMASVAPPTLKASHAKLGGLSNGARPDISALRYYAIRGEQDRVNAEIRRLKALYPGWKQPANIFAAEDGVEKELWSLYAKGKFDEVKARIEALGKTVAGFEPSMDLVTKLEQRENRGDLAKAWTAKDWDTVIAMANANPDLLLGDDVEVIWFVGEAYAQKERPNDAYDAFAAALAVSKTSQERKSTIAKAAQLLSTEASLRLMDSNPDLGSDAKTKGEAGDAIMRGALARSAQLGHALPTSLSERLKQFAARTVEAKSFGDSVLFAWSHFGQRDWAGAEAWFDRALAFGRASNTEPVAMAKALEGRIMATMRLGKANEAAKLARANANASNEIAALYISTHAPLYLAQKPKALPNAELAFFARQTVALSSGEGAEALAWYAYNLKQPKVASAWFSKALEWEETETAAFGLTLAAMAVKDKASFQYLQSRYGSTYAKVAALKFQAPAPKRARPIKRRTRIASNRGRLRGQIARAYNAKRYVKCLQMSRKLRAYGPLAGQDQQMRGWCLLNAKRPAEAEGAFAAAVRLGGKGKREAAYGQALAALRSGKTNAALTIAEANALTAKQRRTVNVELLTQRARAAFNNRDYAASVFALNERAKLARETRDLTFMRGWAHIHAGDYGRARAIFGVLDQQLSTRETERGLATANRRLAYNPSAKDD